MAKKKRKNTKGKKKNYKPLLIGGIITLLLFSVVYFYKKQTKPKPKPKAMSVGIVNACKKSPQFVAQKGLNLPVYIDMSQRKYKGFAVMEAKENGKVLQLPTWDDAGFLGPYALDRSGNIYAGPVPYVSLQFNPPEKQNIIYKVDTRTGKMAKYLELPSEYKPSAQNPFGVMGLAYDCESNSLYTASVAGSGMKSQRGKLFRIDLKAQEIASQIDGIDAIGIGIFKTRNGKRLYYGSARAPEIFSILLDEKGNFSGQPKFEFSLAAQKGGGHDSGHRIRFFKDNRMEIKGVEFSFSLIASSDPLRNIYNFQYDKFNDRWRFIEVHKQ